METPCVQICALDRTTNICVGCGRTKDQITRWLSMTDEERKAIMQALKEKR